MTDYDAIVVGAGHNGLTAAAILQRAGLRTVCLEANTYAGGMAATVELIDGFRYEIAGSVQFPTASQITKDLGLDTLPTVEPDVMSINIGENGEEPMVFYRDPMRLMTHLGEKHGLEAVTGMAELIGWSQGPARALGRFDVRTAAQDPRRNVRVRDQPDRTPRDSRNAVRVGDGRDRPLPARQGQARGHARHARISCRQLHLPRALYTR